MKKLLCASCLAITTIALSPLFGGRPAGAQEQTLSLCNTSRNAVRVYNMNGRTMMRVFNRQSNAVTLNTPAQRTSNPEGINYIAKAETTYTMFAANNGGTCSFQTASLQPESGKLGVSESSLTTTLALCEGNRNTIRIYKEAQQLKMRAYNRQDKATWINGAPASQQQVSNGIDYTNTRGEVQVKVNIPTNSSSCTIAIGSQPAESGTVLARQ